MIFNMFWISIFFSLYFYLFYFLFSWTKKTYLLSGKFRKYHKYDKENVFSYFKRTIWGKKSFYSLYFLKRFFCLARASSFIVYYSLNWSKFAPTPHRIFNKVNWLMSELKSSKNEVGGTAILNFPKCFENHPARQTWQKVDHNKISFYYFQNNLKIMWHNFQCEWKYITFSWHILDIKLLFFFHKTNKNQKKIHEKILLLLWGEKYVIMNYLPFGCKNHKYFLENKFEVFFWYTCESVTWIS